MIPLVARRLRNRIPYVFVRFYRRKNAGTCLKSNLIPEKPTSHIRFGVMKVLSIFVIGVVIIFRLKPIWVKLCRSSSS